MRKIPIVGALCLIMLFSSGCTEKDSEGDVVEEEIKPISAYTVHREKLVSNIEIFGTLEPQSQTTLAAEVSGTVSSSLVQEGDLVSVGQELARFAARENFIQLNYQNALQNYDNAQKLYDLTFRSVQRDEENARIAIEQSEINLSNASVSEEKTDISLESQIESAQKSVEIAETNVEIAELALSNLIESNQQMEDNLERSSRTSAHSALIAFEDIILFTDTVLGVTHENDAQRKVYGAYLSLYDPNLLVRTAQDWKVKNNSVTGLRNTFNTIPANDWDDLIKNKPFFDQAEQVAEGLREFLIQFEAVLTNSRIGGGLTSTELSRLKTETSAHQSSLEGQLSSLISVQQSIDDFLLSAPQNEKNSELSLLSAENQLEQAKQKLVEFSASSDVQRTNTNSQKENAQKSLESAENNLQSIREKNAIQVQNAESGIDAAGNQLDQASLELSKATVKSPVSGVIVSKFIEIGDTISAGSPLFVIAEIDTLTLKGEVDPNELNDIKSTKTGMVFIENFGEVPGILTRYNPIADINTRQVGVEIDIKNYDRAIPANVFATAKFDVPQNKESLLIPLKSLVNQNPAQIFVLVPEKNSDALNTPVSDQTSGTFRVERRTVELGDKHEEFIEVLSGLEVREKIVEERVLGLREGDIVSIADDSLPLEKVEGRGNSDEEKKKEENPDLEFGKELSL